MTRVVRTSSAITPQRAARFGRLVKLLSEAPRSRAVLLQKLKINSRAFFRDVQYLRSRGLLIIVVGECYNLGESATLSRAKLPCPDPELTLAEAQTLSKGTTEAHRKLKRLIVTVLAAR